MCYKMKCIICGEDMQYIKNEKMEKLNWIAMDCPNGCEEGYLIPKNNPNLIKVDE